MVAHKPVESRLDTPLFAISAANHVPINNYRAGMLDVPPSRMFMIGAALDAYRASMGEDAETYDVSQGDGGKSLPGVPVEVLERAFQLQVEHGTSYDKPWGTPLFRQVTAENYWQLDAASGWGPENIAFVQGGRDGLQKIYNAIIGLGHQQIGDILVVSRVPWISYKWGAYGIGLNALLAPGDPALGWRYIPEAIRECAAFARREGREVAGLVITSPDNPTGHTLPLDEQILLARTALEAGYPYVIFDWIYHWVTDGGHSDLNGLLQAFTPHERNRLIVLDGITKSLGASNIRSAHVLAGEDVIRYITSQASHTVVPSFFAQAVAIAAYQMGFDQATASIIEPTRESRKVLRASLERENAEFIMGDGYYAFINCQTYIETGDMTDSEALLKYLGEQFGVAVVPGVYFSDAGKYWVRFSYALPPQITAKAVGRLFQGLKSLL